MKKFNLLFVLLAFSLMAKAQLPPEVEWQGSLGGSHNDVAYSIQQTTDGGYVIAGSSESNDVGGNHGMRDYWVIRLNSNTSTQWQKSLGGSAYDRARFVQQTADGGYIVAGWSESNDGDVSGNHGAIDYWVVKLDSGGNIVWQKSLGGSGNDVVNSAQQTSDGGYIVAGYSVSNDGDVSGNHGDRDYWVVRLDKNGEIVWQKSLGGSDSDEANSISQTADGGYIVGGHTKSNDGDVSGNHGGFDYWIVKLNGSGNIVWQKPLGGSGNEYANSVSQTADGGYIVAGYSGSNDGDVSGNYGNDDYWVVKLDGSGDIIWQKSLGGTSRDRATSIQQVTDGGYIVVGYSESNDGNVSVNKGEADVWVVRLNDGGNMEWQKSLGGSFDDIACSVRHTTDLGYIVAGYSYSDDGDANGHHGTTDYSDYWIIKFGTDQMAVQDIAEDNMMMYPNPAKDFVNLKGLEKGTQIRILDLSGKLIHSETTSSETAQIHLQHFNSGIYVVETISKGIKTSKKLIINQ